MTKESGRSGHTRQMSGLGRRNSPKAAHFAIVTPRGGSDSPAANRWPSSSIEAGTGRTVTCQALLRLRTATSDHQPLA